MATVINIKPGAYVSLAGITTYSVDKIADRFIDAGCPTSRWQIGRALINAGTHRCMVWDRQYGLISSNLTHAEFGIAGTYEIAASALLGTYILIDQRLAQKSEIDEMMESLPMHMHVCTVREVCQHLHNAGYRKTGE